MRFLFPSSILKPRLPDEMFAEQLEAFRAAGFETSLVSLEALATGEALVTPSLKTGETVVYRGWMLPGADYERLAMLMTAGGGVPLTSVKAYLLTHHLPNWYPLIKELTPETYVFPAGADLASALTGLGWARFFIKDYVKSLKTSAGAIIDSPRKAELVVSEMKKYRGTIEGGLCVRRVEDFAAGSETRYFVIYGQPFSACADDGIPAIVSHVAERIQSPFFSVDVAMRSDGELRIVEIGDGQVSDITGWTADRLAALFKTCQKPDAPSDIS